MPVTPGTTEAHAIAARMRAFANCEGNIQYLRKLIYEDSAALSSLIPAVEAAAGAGSAITQNYYKAVATCGSVGECSGNTGMWPLLAAGATAIDAALAVVEPAEDASPREGERRDDTRGR